jgi:hypothetical protein
LANSLEEIQKAGVLTEEKITKTVNDAEQATQNVYDSVLKSYEQLRNEVN